MKITLYSATLAAIYYVSPLSAFSGTVVSTAAKSDSATDSSAVVRTKECIVVGGGPVGLAAALTLSNPPHSYNVTVLEQTEMVYKYDATRAYLYNVNPRGLTWCDTFPKVSEKLAERGSFPEAGVSKLVYVPADPAEPVPPGKKFQLSGTLEIKSRRNYWIPRHSMVLILHECCKEQEEERLKTKNASIGKIELVYGKKLESLETDAQDILTAKCTDGSTYTASLVIGADGMDSSVRACLADKTESSWLQSKPTLFMVRRYKSPATGLKLKALQFPPNFTIPNTTDTNIVTLPESMYVLQSVNNRPRNKVRVGFLPMKDSTLIRPGNTNTRPDHEIWSLRTGPEIKEFYTKAFPRMNWDAVISDDEWDRFAKANGTTFPYCQYSPGSAMPSPSRDTGVVLVGDACHAFPPDIGQGINAGFLDVVALDRVLRRRDIVSGQLMEHENDQPWKLGDALEAYQRNRGPEHKALIQLARCGAPYQYRQSWRRDQVGAFFWTLNAAVRTILNKVTFGLVPPIAIMLCQNHDLTFRQVMRRAHFGAISLKVAALLVLMRLILRRFAVPV